MRKTLLAGIVVPALLATVAVAAPASADTAAAAPEVFAPGVISGDLDETRIAFSPDQKTIYFGRSETFYPENSTILTSTLRDGRWSEPVTASFSGEYVDIDPYVTADGSRMYFTSIRPVNGEARTDASLWVADRLRGGGWGEPRHIPELDSAANEQYSSVGPDGTVYFGSDRSGQWDLWSAALRRDGTYAEPKPVEAPVNTGIGEFNPQIAFGGSALLFARSPLDGITAPDIMVSFRLYGRWSEPVALDAVNTAAAEYHPVVSPDGRHLYFIRHSGGPTNGDLYRIRVRDLF